MEFPSLRPETLYGMPAADQIMFNRYFVIGYSYYFRQAKWALERIDPDSGFPRMENFRPDYRIPQMFRADLVDYIGSKHDRGHLVASANQRETELQNSETFLLSNMSPQKAGFNRGIWRKLEEKVRKLNKRKTILETFVICGPLFDFDKKVDCIGTNDPNDVTIPVPHAYFKSVLAEHRNGDLLMWSFIIPNEKTNKSLSKFLVETVKVEKYAGINLWDRLVGKKIDEEKSTIRKIW